MACRISVPRRFPFLRFSPSLKASSALVVDEAVAGPPPDKPANAVSDYRQRLADLEWRFLAGDERVEEVFADHTIRQQVTLFMQGLQTAGNKQTYRESRSSSGRPTDWRNMAPVDMEPREKRQFEFGKDKVLKKDEFSVKMHMTPVGAKLLPSASLGWLKQMSNADDAAAVLHAVAEIDRKFLFRSSTLRLTATELLKQKISKLPAADLEPVMEELLFGFAKLQHCGNFLETKIFPTAVEMLSSGNLSQRRRARLVLGILQCAEARVPKIRLFDKVDGTEISDHTLVALIEAAVTRRIRDPQFFARLEGRAGDFGHQTLTAFLQAKLHFGLAGPNDRNLAKQLVSQVNLEMSPGDALATANVLVALADAEIQQHSVFVELIGNLKKQLPDLDHSRLGLIGSCLDM